jgi:hypothetical protein
VTYCVTSKEPAGTRRARTYALPDASEVTVTFPTNDVFPETVKVSVSPEVPALMDTRLPVPVNCMGAVVPVVKVAAVKLATPARFLLPKFKVSLILIISKTY